MLGMRLTKGWGHPIGVWLVLLTVIFATEYAVMLLLPWLLPPQASRLFESTVDSIALTLVLAPVLWWTLVRPLREAIRLRIQFLRDLFAQIESDRRQTASELHDGVGQALTLLISGLRSAKICRATTACAGRVDGFQHLAENALIEVRRLALGLRPSLLDDLGLAPALERLVEDVRVHHPVAISLNVAELIERPLSDQVATTVFRIVQEALSNIIKHSQARQAAITVRPSKENAVVEVRDDGCGIPPARLRTPPPGHLGLQGMRDDCLWDGDESNGRPPVGRHGRPGHHLRRELAHAPVHD
ncbi:MAG TPA: ATP-binding protein [Gemmataceae bacterium]|nr:ATP-binding protein [Gemmataceae bacterium]